MTSKTIAWLIPTVAMTVFGWNVSAQAQTIKNFDVEYETLTDIRPFLPTTENELFPEFVRATITGTSTAPADFGLDKFVSNTYGRRQNTDNPSLVKYEFNSNPTAVGLSSDLEAFNDRYFGGDNELFGKANDQAEINLAAGTIQGGGTITIFDGTGVFNNATGQITFTQQDTLGPIGTPAVGKATLKFQLQTPTRQVPENTSTITLLAAGAALSRFKKRKC
jgi:hypothetical protein